MSLIETSIEELTLEVPNPERDAPFAYGWFSASDGVDTLLRMGNAPHEITETTLQSEKQTIEEFLVLEREEKQKTWMIRWKDETIGAAWIDLVENHGVKPPSVHLMIGNSAYRGRGIGFEVMTCMIEYLKEKGCDKVYSRHLASNEAVIRLNEKVGFVRDGRTYADDNGLVWQDVSLLL